MATVNEIVLPTTKPETEWIGGRAVRKSMPTTWHSILQKAFLDVIGRWTDDGERGIVGPEWRFRVSRPETPIYPLVPDVAYMSYERLRLVPEADRHMPTLPPEIVVEILSPSDRRANVEMKREDFLGWGVTLYIAVDPATRSAEFFDIDGHYARIDDSVETYSHPAFPDLSFPLKAMFAKLDVFKNIRLGGCPSTG